MTMNCNNLVILLFCGVIQKENVVYQVQAIKRYKNGHMVIKSHDKYKQEIQQTNTGKRN